MDKIIDIAKVFFEKYFITSILSIILMFVIYFYTPVDSLIIEKFTLHGYLIFLFCLSFIILYALYRYFVIPIIKLIKRNIYSYKENKELINNKYEDMKKMCEQLWEIVDKFSYEDYEFLIRFIENDNQPIRLKSIPYGSRLLNNPNWIHKTEVKPSQDYVENIIRSSDFKSTAHRLPQFTRLSPEYEVKLKKEIFTLLKYSMNEYGKICHFNKTK